MERRHQEEGSTRFNHVAPHFQVRELERAVTFYRETLGMSVDYLDGNPLRYAVVAKDEVYIHLQRCDDQILEKSRAFIAVRGVEHLSRRINESFPAAVIAGLEERDFGQGARFLVFSLQDPDGNLLRIGEPLVPNP